MALLERPPGAPRRLVRGPAAVPWTAASPAAVLLTTPSGLGHVVARLPGLLPRLWGER